MQILRVRGRSTPRAFLLSLLLAASAHDATAQLEHATPFIVNYSARDYDAHSQNWAVAQSSQGIMYFGNGDGVLEFDGVSWRTIPVANHSIVRSLAVDDSDRVYVGAVGELGYLAPDETGTLQYVSLLSELAPEDRRLGDIWRIYATESGIYFWTLGGFLRWHEDAFEVSRIGSKVVPYSIEGRLYFNASDRGLTYLEGSDFAAVEGGEQLTGLNVNVIQPYEEGALLIGARDGRLFVFRHATEHEDATLTPMPTEVDEHLKRHRLYYGIARQDGTFILATMTGGALILNRDGKLLQRFDRSNGLRDDSVWFLFLDNEQELWMALNRGLARVEISTPLTAFGELSGLEGTVEAITRHEGSLYVATSHDLYSLADGRFETRGESVAAPFWDLLDFDRNEGAAQLLVGANTGVFELRQGRLERVLKCRNAFRLFQSSHHPGTVYVGHSTGLSLLRLEDDGQWIDAGSIDSIDDEVRSIAEDDRGRLWLGTHFTGVIRLDPDSENGERWKPPVRFGLSHGLTTLKSIKALHLSDELVFATPDGLFRFVESSQTFEPSDLLGSRFTDGSTGILRLVPDEDRVWLSLHDGDHVSVARRGSDGTYALDDSQLQRLSNGSIHAILPESAEIIWFGGVQGLFRLALVADDPATPTVEPPSSSDEGAAAPATLLRRVQVDRPGGRVLFGGSRIPEEPIVLSSTESSLRFDFSLPQFDAPTENSFRSRLVGLDDTWSEWRNETFRNFTTLREGRYRFEVQGRDVYDCSGAQVAFDFRVLPPAYRTWWAYGAYSVALAGVFWWLLAWQARRTRMKIEIQKLADDNAMMQRAEEERQEFIRELEAKNTEMERFIYTVSHDLRGPLITVRGFLGMLEKDVSAGDEQRMARDMELIHTATGKMADLLDKLLELSRIGRITGETKELPLTEVAQDAVDQIAGAVRERGVDVSIAPDLPIVIGDRQRLQEALQNLIENAVKYMGDQPDPRIEIAQRQDGEETVFYIRDNGLGIDPRYQDKVFELFERLDSRTEGTGIGLALVQRIIEGHGGRIWVESAGEGQGSTFCFTLG